MHQSETRVSAAREAPAPQPPLAPSLAERVLARLPEADQVRQQRRRNEYWQHIAALVLVSLGMIVCVGPETSNLATHMLAWSLAGSIAWSAIVRTLLHDLDPLPALSAVCLVALAILLWQRLIRRVNWVWDGN